MPQGDLLKIGLSGLLAFQRGLAVTSQNITNVNTEGYSRQRAEFEARKPLLAANGFVGTGTNVETVRRMHDEFLDLQVRANSSAFGQMSSYAEMADRIDTLIADQKSGLSPSIQQFFNSLEEVASDPASVSVRRVMLGEARALAARFHFLDNRFTELGNNVNKELEIATGEINGIARSVSSLNREIVLAIGQSGGQPPNDLLDKRDTLLAQLSERVNINTVSEQDGSISVFIGNGQPLVVGVLQNSLGVADGAFDADKKEITLSNQTSSSIITSSLTGGSLTGMLQFRDEMLYPTQNELGRIANVLATSFNAQHNAGLTLGNVLGGDFFDSGTVQIYNNNNNSGSGSLSVSISSATSLTASDYQVIYDGTNHVITRLSDNTSQTLAGAGPFVVDGLTITPTGSPTSGDLFEIQANRNGGRLFDVAVSNVRDIAAAAPIRARAQLSNLGEAQITQGEVLDATNLNLLNTATLTFLTANTYSINNAGSFAYTSGANIDINGARVVISGSPQVGDIFVQEANNSGAGDNRNALKLSLLQSTGIINGGTSSYYDAYNEIVASVGTTARELGINKSAQDVILKQSKEYQSSVSGVNLDEEGANLMRFQQAYAAAAQVISTSNTVFQTLMDAFRR